MSKVLESFDRILEDNISAPADIEIVLKIIKAFEIIKKYFKPEDTLDDLFPYGLKDLQYVSSRSCNAMTKEEFEFLKEVF